MIAKTKNAMFGAIGMRRSRRRHIRALWALGGLGLGLFQGAPVDAAPITFNTGLPVSAGHWVGRAQTVYGEASSAGNEIEEIKSTMVLGYGATPDLAIFGIVPWVSRDLDLASGGRREASGLADMRVFARYTAYSHDVSGGTFRIAPFLGLEMPTGENRKSDALGLLPPGLQPGSGSWDPFGGVVVSWATLDWNLDGQVSWQANTRADGVEMGDLFQADLAVYKRLLPAELSADTASFLLGGVEFNFEDEGRTRLSGAADPDSGGQRFFITPGLQYAGKLWMAEVAVQIPVARNLNGANFDRDFALQIGLRLNL